MNSFEFVIILHENPNATTKQKFYFSRIVFHFKVKALQNYKKIYNSE